MRQCHHASKAECDQSVARPPTIHAQGSGALGGGLLGHLAADGRANYHIAVVGEDALPGLSGEARMVAKREDHVRYVRPFLKGKRLMCPCAWRRAGFARNKSKQGHQHMAMPLDQKSPAQDAG